MNATNHHKIIASLGLDANKTKVLENASDFTDDFCNDSNSISIEKKFLDLDIKLTKINAVFNQDKYFFFHFYYDIECEKGQCGEGKITLRRSKKDENKTRETIEKCTLGKNEKKYKKYQVVVDTSPNSLTYMEPGRIPFGVKESYDEIKEFFTLINGREKYFTKDFTDSSNQSDCVAFLHAMAAKDEESEQDKLVFEDPGEDKALKRLKELEKEDWKKVLDNLQDQLSVAGLLPGIGTGFDVANTVISILRGDLKGAAFSLVCAVPVVGDAFGVVAKAATKKAPTIITKHITTEFVSNVLQNVAGKALDGFGEAKIIIEEWLKKESGGSNVSSSNTSFCNGSETARDVFEEHLKKCFAEFLFLKDDEALFMLGIALHGIMDSFTPSHTTFQKYLCQNMALHAQGDVVPIKPQNTKNTSIAIDKFDPGEADAETWVIGGKSVILSLLKGYGESIIPLGYLNTYEYRMLWIYLLISDISPTTNGVGKELSLDEIQRLWKTFDGYSLNQINDILNKGYIYGNRAWVYSDNAIKAVSEIYTYLDKEKEKINDYPTYLKKKDDIIGKALNKWKSIYDNMYKDEEFKKRQNLLRLIFKEDADMMNSIMKRYLDGKKVLKSKLDSAINESLIWSGDAIDSAINKGKEIANSVIDKGKDVANSIIDTGKEITDSVIDEGKDMLDSYAKQSVENVTDFPFGGNNKV